MTQNRNDRRAGPQSSARPRRPQTQNGSHRAYDWTQDRQASAPQRRTRSQGYQEQTLDFSGGDGSFEHYGDNSIQFPQQTARRPNGQSRAGQARRPARPQGQRPRRQNTQPYPRSGQRPGSAQSNGRYRPTEANLRSPARREGKKKRRLTRAAIRRRRAIRRLTALALLLCVIGVGVYLTVTMLFKINTLQVVSDGAVIRTE